MMSELLNMLPCSPLDDGVDQRTRNPVLLGERVKSASFAGEGSTVWTTLLWPPRLRWFIGHSNGAHDVFGQDGVGIGLASVRVTRFRSTHPSFKSGILHVLLASSGPEMIGVDADPVVARMTDFSSDGDRPNEQRVGKLVCPDLGPVVGVPAVAGPFGFPQPRPAGIRPTTLIDLCPEPLDDIDLDELTCSVAFLHEDYCT